MSLAPAPLLPEEEHRFPEDGTILRQAFLPLYRPYAAWVLLIINIAIFLIPEILGLNPIVQALGMKENQAILQGEYYRLFTAMFLHGSITHLFFNSFALYSFGRDVERFLGTFRFLVIYFLAGLAGSIASYVISPNPSLGASGAIFGLVGAMGAFFLKTRHVFQEMSRQQIANLIFMVLLNLGIGFTTPRIDNAAHIGGLIMGALAGYALTPALAPDPTQEPMPLVRTTSSYAWPACVALLCLLVAAFLIGPAR